MAVKDIVRVWNNKGIIKKNLKTLIMPLKEVQFPLSDEDNKLILDLKDTANKLQDCAGIAANQIGYDKSIFIGLKDYDDTIDNDEIEEKEAAFYGTDWWKKNVDFIRGHHAHREIVLIEPILPNGA